MLRFFPDLLNETLNLSFKAMQEEIMNLVSAAEGLMYMSESDHPFEPITIEGKNIQEELLKLAGTSDAQTIETVSVDHFFRNMVNPEVMGQQTSDRYKLLKQQLNENLKDPEVYRIGTVQVQIFIVGRLKNGKVGGLRTMSIET